MTGYDWPGNVRELRNVVERAVIMSDPKLLRGDPLDALAELRRRAEPAMHHRVSLRAARDATEREYLEDLVRATDWNLDQAASYRRGAPQVARAPLARAPHQAPGLRRLLLVLVEKRQP